MSFLSIKKSTLNLKGSILRQAHRFSSAHQPPSPKRKHEQPRQKEQTIQQQPLEKTPASSPLVSTPSSQNYDLLSIFVSEATHAIIANNEKNIRHEQTPLILFSIVVDHGDKQVHLSRSASDVIALEQLFKKYHDDIPSLPIFTNTTITSSAAPTLTNSVIHNFTLRRLFPKSKSRATNEEKLQLWLRLCAMHPILSRSSQWHKFLSPQREQDTVVNKTTRTASSQHQDLYHSSTAAPATTKETPTMLHIYYVQQQQQQQQHQQQQQQSPLQKAQHSSLPIHSVSTVNEYHPSIPTETIRRYNLDDPVLTLSSIISLHLDSVEVYSGTASKTKDQDDDSIDSNCGNEGDESFNSDCKIVVDCDDDDDGGDSGLHELASLLPSPPSESSFGFIDDWVSTSGVGTSIAIHHPLLMSSTRQANRPSLGKGNTDETQVTSSSINHLVSTTYQQMDPTKEHKQTSRMTLDDLQFLKVLGKGCMGKVMLVRHHQSARLYALKSISKEWVITQREIDHTIMERNILSKVSKIHHPFLIKLHHSFQDANQLFLVLDYHVGSDLATQLQLHYSFDAARCRFYTAEILLGLQELHRLGILYRDLKPENILLAADGHIVLTDFGFSRLFDENEENQLYSLESAENTRRPYHTRTFCGTVEYMAAEMYLSEEYTFAVDYWSLGIILYEMVLGYTPFDADNDSELYRRVLEDPIDIPEDMSLDTADLILGLLERDPRDRLGCAQFYEGGSDSQSILDQDDIRQHPYFYHLDWSDVYNKRLPAPFVPHIKSETDVSHFAPDFINLSPRLSAPCRHEDFGDYDDDDIYDLDPDCKAWEKTRYKDQYYYEDDQDQQYLEDAFAGYSYINENTCVDTDSLLNEDNNQHHQCGNDGNTTVLGLVDTISSSSEDSSLIHEGIDHISRQYRGTACMAITTTATVTSTTSVTAASTHYHHRTNTPEQLLSYSSSRSPYCTNLRSTTPSQQLGFPRLQHRYNQHYSTISSSSLSLSSSSHPDPSHQNESDEFIWLH
ncbi:kinase-like domain-containing protein [Absidia repens]|uniref:Kinase-like domain-containing protein n=1 Tax=Absidia repens TaxID=90262 RepID=A0A1X2IFQ0_9FUNG|nr:kinase-like domain-containing protein [Absidia repens]